MDKLTALAMIGYAAYCAASNGLAFDGSPLKTWGELDEPRQNNWRANAKAIEDAVIAEQSGAVEASGFETTSDAVGVAPEDQVLVQDEAKDQAAA